jgi:uncharacterized membrane protein YedE/YeeE
VKAKIVALLFGVGFGLMMCWARLSDPTIIRNMLLLRELDVFLLMGSAVATAAVGVRLLRVARLRALATGEAIDWKSEAVQKRHLVGSAIFGTGWAIAGTCPGPVAAMIGEGRLGGVWVALGITGGALLQGALARSRSERKTSAELPGAAGL